MPLHGMNNLGVLSVSLGEDLVLEHLTTQFPDAVAEAQRRVERLHGAGHVSLIANMSPEEFLEDRSDEVALVGTLKK